MPGVMKVVLAKDVPVNLNTLLSLLDFGIDDEPTLAEKKVAYMGEPVVAVIATTEKLALDAVAKVDVQYEVIDAVFDVEEAIKPNSPTVNQAYPENHFRNLGTSKLSMRNVFYIGSKNGITIQDENNVSKYDPSCFL